MIRNMTSVFMTEENRHINANEFLDNCDEEKIFTFRRKLEEARTTSPIALCSVCYQPIVLRGNIQRSFFFAHTKNSDDCPIKTTTNLTHDEILAMKFNGQKEGRAHKENKFKLAELLKIDKFFTNEILVESTFREINSSGIAKRWRRPDISTISAEKKYSIVFELQVSTTFIEVIIGREKFYKENDTYIMWIFLNFDRDKFTTLDIGYGNNSNVFVFDDEAKEISSKNQRLTLKCYYRKPYISNSLSIDYAWECQLVDFNDMSFDSVEKKIYFADSNLLTKQAISEIKSTKQKIEQERIERKERELKERQKDLENRSQIERNRNSNNKNLISYPSKRDKTKDLSSLHKTSKSFGDAVKCAHCGKIVKIKKIGSILLCENCFQPIDKF